jgi:hypothetical protein
MFKRIEKLLRVRVLVMTMSLIMMLFSLTVAPTPPVADACCPPMADHETLITYYTDSTHTTWSGMRRTLCSGYWTQIGTVTSHYTVEHPPCDCEVTPC